jgi:hypothetical protein
LSFVFHKLIWNSIWGSIGSYRYRRCTVNTLGNGAALQ